MEGNVFAISPGDLYVLLGTAAAPVLIDVRHRQSFEGDGRLIIGVVRRPPDQAALWRRNVPAGRIVVAYCADGREASRDMASALRSAGIEAGCRAGESIAGVSPFPPECERSMAATSAV